jgi:arylsulfatase A-like enzyme
LIREYGGKKPFFIDVSFNAVHAPLAAPERYQQPYAHLKDRRRTYAGVLAAMDEAVGQIVAALDEKGLRQNTLIVFSSDNGGPAPGVVTDNGTLRAGKATLYEGGVRVAAFATWEGHVKPGTVVSQPLHMVDWYPTLLKLAGATLTQKLPIDGLDAWPTIAAGKPSPHKEILINATPATGAIRAGEWKLLINGGYNEMALAEAGGKKPAADTVELFNLTDDPSEKTNLAEKHPEKVKDLRARYSALAAQAVAPKIRPRSADFIVPKIWGEQ